jgi:predicted ATPase/class 3 adenylate cyclase/DNA-binding CsgD family transcriptional regulator
VGELPSGAVTFLFSDIEGSTRLVKTLRERYAPVLAEHRRLVRAAIAGYGGHEVDTQGDAFFAAFGEAKRAVLCALQVQRSLATHDWPDGARVRVRMGIHTGHAVPADGAYTGLAVHRAARICAAARGGQVLVSQATQTLVEDEEESEQLGFALVPVGEHRLKDLDRPVLLFELAAAGLDPPRGLDPPGAPDAGTDAAGGPAAGLHGWSAALTSFVGRAAQVDEVAGLLDEFRLVTVAGPGGAGKTRLAGEVARRVAGRFADGAWLVELGPVRDPAQVASVVAAALGVREQPGLSAADAVARVLARQQLLLVLDNCEQVIATAAALCGRVLAAADDLRILATSREPLRVAGEARYRLAPLALPGLDDLAEAARAEAVALFADRARQADTHFALDERTGPAVARLVRRLDGMPLAIELAAARVETLGVTQLLDRLGDRFDLLTAADRAAPERHQSLAATVDWSYQLLGEHEQQVFRAVSVFPGPFTLEAAEAVAGPGADVAVLRLVDCSLLVPPRTGPDGRSRYAMLETLRTFAAVRLAEVGEQDRAAAALAGYALRVAEEALAGLQTGSAELAALRRLDAEDATTRQALAWALEHDHAMAPRLAVALAPWWLLRGRAAGEDELLRAAARYAETGSEVWCDAQFWRGETALHAADLNGALGHFTAIMDAIADQGPSRALAEALTGRSIVFASLGQLAEAIEEGRRAQAMARTLDIPDVEALALQDLAIAAINGGDFGGALQLIRQLEQIHADLPGWLARVGSNILIGALIESGELAAAEQLCTAVLTQARDAGDLRVLGSLLDLMADLDLRAGRTGDATARLREALQLTMRTGIWFELINILNHCGELCALTGRPAEALTTWAAYVAFAQREGFVEDPHTDDRLALAREARETLGPAAAAAAEERGSAMSTATAAEYVLVLTAPTAAVYAPDVAPDVAPGSGLEQLDERERELVTLVAQGRTDAEIAARLRVSVRTVSSRLGRIRDKTGCRRRADLTGLALQAGLV